MNIINESLALPLHKGRAKPNGSNIMKVNMKMKYESGGVSTVLSFGIAALMSLTSNQVNAAPSKNIINFALQSEPPQLDSTKATDTQSSFVLGHIMEGLTRHGKNGDVVPGVAEKWKVDDKGATFTLRKNAKWSDGKPVTAKDFIFSWKTALDPKTASEYAFILYPIKNAEKFNKGQAGAETLGISAPDDHTLKVVFEQPCGYFLGLTAFTTYFPVREDFYKARSGKYAADAKDILANGPFVLTQWTHGSTLQLDKNAHYWNASAIKIDGINIPYITADNNALFNFFKDRKVDMLERLNKDDLAKAQSEKLKMKSFSDGSVFFLEFNFREGRITKNKHLRKAIQLVFNPSEYTGKVVGIPGTKPGSGLVPGWVRGTKDFFRKEYPVSVPKANVAAAKAELQLALKDLGLTKAPSLAWLTGDTPLAAKEAEYFQNLLKSTLGIELRIDKQIFKQRLAKMTAGDFDIVSAGWGPDFADPMTFAELKASWNENNRGKYASADYDKFIRAAQATSDPKKRMDAMAAAEKLMLEETVLVPLYERTVVYVTSDRIQGVTRHAIGADPDFTTASVVNQ